MKKNTISKLAVMGILSGSLITSANAEQSNTGTLSQGSMTMLAAGCGAGKCNGQKPDNANSKSSSYTADRGSCGSNNPSNYNYNQNSSNQGEHRCGGARPNNSNQNPSNPGDNAKCGSTRPLDSNQEPSYTADRAGCSSSRPNNYNQKPSYTADRDAIYDSLSEAETADNAKAKKGDTKKMTEKELMSQLNEKGKELYNSLDADGKAMALKLASGSCKGKNDCKGQSACKSDKNSCAGENKCKGEGTAMFKDKNMAVRIASKKMAEKRSLMNSGKK
jgi:hypothetical protein